MKQSSSVYSWVLGILALTSLICLAANSCEFILPVFDPEFVMTPFWDFESSFLLTSLFSALFIYFGLPIAGFVILALAFDYSRHGITLEGED